MWHGQMHTLHLVSAKFDEKCSALKRHATVIARCLICPASVNVRAHTQRKQKYAVLDWPHRLIVWAASQTLCEIGLCETASTCPRLWKYGHTCFPFKGFNCPHNTKSVTNLSKCLPALGKLLAWYSRHQNTGQRRKTLPPLTTVEHNHQFYNSTAFLFFLRNRK